MTAMMMAAVVLVVAVAAAAGQCLKRLLSKFCDMRVCCEFGMCMN